jgi:hypothetical protein
MSKAPSSPTYAPFFSGVGRGVSDDECIMEHWEQGQGYYKQICQVSRFNRETHNFLCFLTISRLSPQISRFSAKSLLKPQVIPNTRRKKKYAIIS